MDKPGGQRTQTGEGSAVFEEGAAIRSRFRGGEGRRGAHDDVVMTKRDRVNRESAREAGDVLTSGAPDDG